MGWIGPISDSNSASAEGVSYANSAGSLCRDGALAGLAGNNFDGLRDLPLRSSSERSRELHLTALLDPLDDQPANLARRLLKHFGSLSAIVSATETELRQVWKQGERWIEAFLVIRQLLADGMREELMRSQLGADRRALDGYLLQTMCGLRKEQMIAIFADAQKYVIAVEKVTDGELDNLTLSPRRLFVRAMNLNADRILIAHNHPSGVATPSQSDIQQTQLLIRKADLLGIAIEDHLIVGRREVFSMRDRGLI